MDFYHTNSFFFFCYLEFCWRPKRMSSWNSLNDRCILQPVFSRFGPLVSCSHSTHTPMWFDWDWWRTFRWICQCAVDGLILTFCVYLQRHAHLAQLSQLSLGRQLIQSWRRLTGDCILSNSSSANSIILPVLFFVSPSLPPSVHSFSSLLWVYKYRKDIHGGVLNIPRQTLTSLKSSSLLDSLELHFILFIHSDNKLFVI